ncbi:MAG TPA: DUF3237 family protein [Ktedonobacterales bacterium]|nr:DUF3237 family protein [Ktedonobacterales bacterium]
MRLDYLCDLELAHQEEPVYGRLNVLVRPYGSEEGTAYGEGGGTFTGSIQGKARWVNHPRRRSDGTMLPETHGVIMTDDGAAIMFTFQGRTVFEGSVGKQLLTISFEAEDERYRWLNQAVCVVEGLVSIPTLAMRGRVYCCVHELAYVPTTQERSER